MFVQIVFRPLRNKGPYYSKTTMDVARVFFIKILYTFVTDTHARAQFNTDTFVLIFMDYRPSLTAYAAWVDRQRCFLNRVAIIIH